MTTLLITETVHASSLFAESLIAAPWGAQAARDYLIRAVIAEADKRACKVRPQSVKVYEDSGLPDRQMIRYSAVWSPRSAQFIGGEYDGDELVLGRSIIDGLPPARLTLPYRGSATLVEAHMRLSSNPIYERVGTHPILDVWIYEHVPTR